MHPLAPEARLAAQQQGLSLPAMLGQLVAERAATLSDSVQLAQRLHVLPEFLGNRAPLADPHARVFIAGLGMQQDMDSLVALYVAGLCGIAYGLRQIVDAQAANGIAIDRIMISGGAGRPDLVRQLLADATGKPVLANEAEEPVLPGAAVLGSVAAAAYPDVGAAMAGMSRIGKRYTPQGGAIGAAHQARFVAFEKLQGLAAQLRQ